MRKIKSNSTIWRTINNPWFRFAQSFITFLSLSAITRRRRTCHFVYGGHFASKYNIATGWLLVIQLWSLSRRTFDFSIFIIGAMMSMMMLVFFLPMFILMRFLMRPFVANHSLVITNFLFSHPMPVFFMMFLVFLVVLMVMFVLFLRGTFTTITFAHCFSGFLTLT